MEIDDRKEGFHGHTALMNFKDSCLHTRNYRRVGRNWKESLTRLRSEEWIHEQQFGFMDTNR